MSDITILIFSDQLTSQEGLTAKLESFQTQTSSFSSVAEVISTPETTVWKYHVTIIGDPVEFNYDLSRYLRGSDIFIDMAQLIVDDQITIFDQDGCHAALGKE